MAGGAYKPAVARQRLRLGDLVSVGGASAPAIVVSPDVRFMLSRGPRRPVIGVALHQAGGWWEPAFFLPEDVKRREVFPAPV